MDDLWEGRECQYNMAYEQITGAIPMTLPIRVKEDNSKNFVNDIPPELLPIIAKFATQCTGFYRSDDPTADFAEVENKLFAMTSGSIHTNSTLLFSENASQNLV